MSILADVRVHMNEFELTGSLNQMELGTDIEQKDETVFGSSVDTRLHVSGLETPHMNLEGFSVSGAGEIETVIAAIKASATPPIFTVNPDGSDEGDIAYVFKSNVKTFEPIGGAVGDSNKIRLQTNRAGDGTVGAIGLKRGRVMEVGTLTASDVGAAQNFGAPLGNNKCAFGIHITAVSGTNPTLDMIIRTDDAEGMATPVTRITVPQITGVGSWWSESEEATVDTWWQASYTIGGTDSPTFVVMVALAVQGQI